MAVLETVRKAIADGDVDLNRTGFRGDSGDWISGGLGGRR